MQIDRKLIEKQIVFHPFRLNFPSLPCPIPLSMGVFNCVRSPSSLSFIEMNINTFELTDDGERLIAEVQPPSRLEGG